MKRRSKRQRRKRNIKIGKKVNVLIPIHTTNKVLKKCLIKDDIKMYIEKYDCQDIIKYFKYKNRRTFNISDVSLISCILYYNYNEIVRHVMINNIPIYKDFVYLFDIYSHLNSRKTNVKDAYVKLILDMFLVSKLTNKEICDIMDKLISLKIWYVIDYLHRFGYVPKDKEKIMRKMSYEKIKLYSKYGYQMDDKYFVNLCTKGVITLEELKKLKKFHNTFADNKFNTDYMKMFEQRPIDFVEFAVDNGYKIDQKCMDIACDNINLPAVIYLLKQKFKMSENNLRELLHVEKIKKVRKRKYTRHSKYLLMKKIVQCLDKIYQYEDNMIEILRLCDEESLKNIDKIMPLCWEVMVCLGYFKLIIYIQNNLKINNIKISKNSLWRIIHSIIRKDNVNNLKMLFTLEIIEPIYISSNPKYYNTAFRYKSVEMMEYFARELNMICTNEIIWDFEYDVQKPTRGRRWGWGFLDKINVQTMRRIKKYNKKDKVIKNIDCLRKVNFPLEKAILEILCQNGHLKGVKYVFKICDNIEPFPNALIRALAHKHYKVVDYLLSKGWEYNKSRILYSVLSCTKCTISLIKYICTKLGAKCTRGCANILMKVGNISCLKYVYKTYNISPSKNIIVKYFKNCFLKCNEIVKILQYCEKLLKINPFEGLDNDTLEQIIKNVLSIPKISTKLLDDITKKTNFEYNMTHMYYVIDSYCSLQTIQYLESKGVNVTKSMFIKALICVSMRKIEYLMNKYKYTITLKDLNGILLYENYDRYEGYYISWGRLRKILSLYNLKMTPYTVTLVANNFINNHNNRWYGCSIFAYVLEIVGKIKQE